MTIYQASVIINSFWVFDGNGYTGKQPIAYFDTIEEAENFIFEQTGTSPLNKEVQ